MGILLLVVLTVTVCLILPSTGRGELIGHILG